MNDPEYRARVAAFGAEFIAYLRREGREEEAENAERYFADYLPMKSPPPCEERRA